MNTTIDEEYALLERFSSNAHEAKIHALYMRCLVGEAHDKIMHPLRLQCVVCGEAMKAQRRSKKTCSSRCRLRFSRWRRAFLALPKKEIRRREAEVRKRHKAAVRAARRAAAEEEKRQPKRSLDELTADIKRTLTQLKEA